MIDITIGTKITIEPSGNATRTFGEGPIQGTITSIDDKYFYVSIYGDENAPDNWPLQFDKLTLTYRGDTHSRYYIYKDLETYTRRKKAIKMAAKLRRYFMDFTTQYDYDTIKQVYDILVAAGAIEGDTDE